MLPRLRWSARISMSMFGQCVTTSFVLLLSDLPWSTRMSIYQCSVPQPVLSYCCQTCPGLHVCPYVNAQCHNQFCPIVVRLALVYAYVHVNDQCHNQFCPIDVVVVVIVTTLALISSRLPLPPPRASSFDPSPPPLT